MAKVVQHIGPAQILREYLNRSEEFEFQVVSSRRPNGWRISYRSRDSSTRWFWQSGWRHVGFMCPPYYIDTNNRQAAIVMQKLIGDDDYTISIGTDTYS